jgi:hypothetical protein
MRGSGLSMFNRREALDIARGGFDASSNLSF